MQEEALKGISEYDGLLKGIGAIVIFMLFFFKDGILGYLAKKTKSKNGTGINPSGQVVFQVTEILKKLEQIVPKINNLEEWHDVDDPEQPGVKIWWFSKQLKQTLDNLTKAVNELSQKISSMK